MLAITAKRSIFAAGCTEMDEKLMISSYPESESESELESECAFAICLNAFYTPWPHLFWSWWLFCIMSDSDTPFSDFKLWR